MPLQFVVIPPQRGVACVRPDNAVHRYHVYVVLFTIALLLAHIDVRQHAWALCGIILTLVLADLLLLHHDAQYAWI